MIKAEVIQHSISQAGKPLIAIVAEYPRCIHGELMTHRVFSRNAMSSRAVPVRKMIDQVRRDPFVPYHWGANQPGMQAHQEVSPARREEAIHEWYRAAEHAAYFADRLDGLGVHKQIVNRLLEPFQWMRTIISTTELDNFYELRDHPDAEPHFQLLARAIRRAEAESTPVLRGDDPDNIDNWHLPFIHDHEREAVRGNGMAGAILLAQVSAARCARISYLLHDGHVPDLDKDLALYTKLAGSKPIHASPLEHQAFPATSPDIPYGNFLGWVQFRKIVEQPIMKLEGE
jgi:hypothetical protein